MTRTVAPSTVTNGRLSVVPGAAIVVATAQALAPRGRRQKCSEVTLLSGPYHAMYAVPAASTATPSTSAPAGPALSTSVPAQAAPTDAPIATAVASHAKASVIAPAGAAPS